MPACESAMNLFNCLVPGGSFIFPYVSLGSMPGINGEWMEVMRYPLDDALITCRQRVTCGLDSDISDYEYLYEISGGGRIIETEQQEFP